MIVYGKEKLEAFALKNEIAKSLIDTWLHIFEEYTFKDHDGLKVIFPSVEYIGNERYMFNLKGSDFKIVIVIAFINSTVAVRWIGTNISYKKLKDCSTF